jgi:hypothetical protein
MSKFRTKTSVVEAMQFTEESPVEVADWCNGELRGDHLELGVDTVVYGDWVVKDGDVFTGLSNDAFEDYYEDDDEVVSEPVDATLYGICQSIKRLSLLPDSGTDSGILIEILTCFSTDVVVDLACSVYNLMTTEMVDAKVKEFVGKIPIGVALNDAEKGEDVEMLLDARPTLGEAASSFDRRLNPETKLPYWADMTVIEKLEQIKSIMLDQSNVRNWRLG